MLTIVGVSDDTNWLPMFRLFRKSSTYVDQQFAELSLLFHQDLKEPTHKRELLEAAKLDFSLESLKHVDAYLEALHENPVQDTDETARVVLRTGALPPNAPSE